MLHYEVVEYSRKSKAAHADIRTLVCLHGFLESSGMWSVLKLQDFANLILIDLPGHGKSDLNAITSMQLMAEAVFEVLQKEGVTSYKVIGHSMGGYVGLELQQMDSRCNEVILMNSNVWTDSEQKVTDRKRVAKLVQTKKDRFVSEAIPNLFQDPEDFEREVNSLVAEAQSMKIEAIAQASIAMSQRQDFTEQVYSGAIPIQIIQGEFDPIAPKDQMEQIFVNFPEKFHVVSSGHMAHFEATEDVQEILKEIIG